MAEELKAQVTIEAQDRATEVITDITRSLGFLGEAMSAFALSSLPAALAIGGVLSAIALLKKSVDVSLELSEVVEELDRLSARTGVSIENLQVLRRLFILEHADVNALTTSLQFLNRSIATQDPLLAKLGVKTKDTHEAFLQLIDIFARTPNNALRTEIAVRLMGRSVGEVLSIVPKLKDELGAVGDQMSALGGIITGEPAEALRELGEDAERLWTTWDSTWIRLEQKFVPIATHVVDWLNKIADAITGVNTAPEEVQVAANLEFFEKQLAEMEQRLARRKKGFSDVFAQINEGASAFDIFAPKLVKAPDPNAKLPGVAFLEGQVEQLKLIVEGFKAGMAALEAEAAEGVPDSLAGFSLEDSKALQEMADLIQKLQDVMKLSLPEAQQYALALKAIADQKFTDETQRALGKFIGPELTAEAKKFAADIDEIMRLSGKTWDEAVAGKRKMDAALDAKKAIELKIALGEITEAEIKLAEQTAALTGFFATFGATAEDAAAITRQFQDFQQQVKMGFKPEEERETPAELAKRWTEALNEITDATGVAEAGLNALFNGLQSGFSQAFAGIIAGTATLKSTVMSLITSMVDAVLSELARIAAAQLVLGILNPAGFFAGLFKPSGVGGLTDVVAEQPPLPVEFALAPPPELPPLGPVPMLVQPPPDLPPLGPVPLLVAPPDVPELDPLELAVMTPTLPEFAPVELTATLQQPRLPRMPALPVALQTPALPRLGAATLAVRTPQPPQLPTRPAPPTPQPSRIPLKVETPESAPKEPIPTNITNVMVLGYDNHTIVQDLTSPDGKLRAANARTAFIGAY